MEIERLKNRLSTKCICGKELSINNLMSKIEQYNNYQFYGGNVEAYAKIKCSCGCKYIVFLKKEFNTYKIFDSCLIQGNKVYQPKIKKAEKPNIEVEKKLVCEKCGRVFSNKQGLGSHRRKCTKYVHFFI